jgi:hypothetical protein
MGTRKLERKSRGDYIRRALQKAVIMPSDFSGLLFWGCATGTDQGAYLGAVRRAVLIVRTPRSSYRQRLINPLHPDSTRLGTWQWIVFSSMNVFSIVMPDGHSETRQRHYRPRVGWPREELFARCIMANVNHTGGWPGLVDGPLMYESSPISWVDIF